jgi:hypothetical protein
MQATKEELLESVFSMRSSPRLLNESIQLNVTLTLGWITLFMGDMGEGALHREDEVTVKQRN